MKTILLVIIFFLGSTQIGMADYTIEIKNESGTVISSKTVTSDQVKHLQKASARTGKSVINYFWESIADLLSDVEHENKSAWTRNNDVYINEQSIAGE